MESEGLRIPEERNAKRDATLVSASVQGLSADAKALLRTKENCTVEVNKCVTEVS